MRRIRRIFTALFITTTAIPVWLGLSELSCASATSSPSFVGNDVDTTTIAGNQSDIISRVNTTFAERIANHNLMALYGYIQTPGSSVYVQIVKAHAGIMPLDASVLEQLMARIGDGDDTSDFAIAPLIRLWFLTSRTNGSAADAYDALFRPVLQSERYWYTTDPNTTNDDIMNSENHMILWMSSGWLLHERLLGSTPPPTNTNTTTAYTIRDPTLRQRLVHFLQLKVKYGFYEFLSITYLPFTMGGLLNLVDFCKDSEIRSLADAAVRRLVSDYLWFVNDQGIHYSVAGRDYAERFVDVPYSQPMDAILYLLTGLGQFIPQRSFGHSTFLSTSTINFTAQVAAWQASVDTTYRYGHTLSESFAINAKLEKYDRIVFQFSQGAYAHPLTYVDTVDFLNHFGPIKFKNHLVLDGSFLPVPSSSLRKLPPILSALLERLNVGSVASGNSIRLYRNGSSMLSSVHNFWPGAIGAQAFPWMAVAGDVPVWTQSGLITEQWTDRDSTIGNTHLPFVAQQANAALVIYQPAQPMAEWADVALYWPVNRFDQVTVVSARVRTRTNSIFVGSLLFGALKWIFARHNSRNIEGDDNTLLSDTEPSWILGRKGDAYVAIYRPCGNAQTLGWYACPGVAGRQLWAVVVGNAATHGSWEAFGSVIAAASIEETTRGKRLLRKPSYTTSLRVNGLTLRHVW
jgi:hypothetical protein